MLYNNRSIIVLAFLISIVFSYEDLVEDSSAREQEQEQEQSDNPDYEVKLSVDTAPKSPTVITSEELETVTETLNPTNTDLFSCHECTDCYSNGEIKKQMCQTGTRHCYTIYKRIGNVSHVVRRGCSTSKSQCTVPSDYYPFETFTCCIGQLCNRANDQLSSSLILSIVTIFIHIAIGIHK